MSNSAPERKAEAITYLISGLLCCAALVWVFQLWRAEIRIPIQYGYSGDLAFECMLAKDMADSGWILHNPRLGAPGEQDLRDFPMADLVTFVSMKALSWFTSSWGAIVNLYFFAGFFLITWSALAVLRHFGIARAPAVVGALLFAFTPYHFYRSEWHLHLSAYFVVPLAALLMLWVMSDEPLFQGKRPSTKGGVALGACLLLGSDGAYYASFTIMLLLAAGLYRAFGERSWRRAGTAVLLAGVIVLTAVVNLLPNIVHMAVDGKNPEVAVRGPEAAEIYALKLSQLVLPIGGHRIQRLAAFKAKYNRGQPAGADRSDTVALGGFAAAGFCFLMVSLVAGYPWSRHGELVRRLGLLNLCAFLIGTLGGVGSLMAWTIWPQIRAYNRIVVFIAFFSMMAAVAVLDEIARRWTPAPSYRWLWGAVFAGILVAALWEQTTRAWVPPYEQFASEYHSDAAFAAQAESRLPRGTMVLQLPFLPFPEAVAPGSMKDYDPLMPYLHSTSLRWSYGAMKGRYGGMWEARLAALPWDDTLDSAAAAGFGAICIDRNGYADRGAAIGGKLSALGLGRIEAPDGRFWLYDIRPYAARLQAEFTAEDWARAREAVLHPVVMQWLPQCSALEGDARRNWRWCGSQDAFLLENSSAQPQRLEIHGTVTAAAGGECSVRVDGPGWEETVALRGTAPQPLAHTLELPPGSSTVQLRSDCRRLAVPTDTRSLIFRIDDFHAALEAPAPEPELTWGTGCSPLEKDAGKGRHGCSSSGDLIIRNAGAARETRVRMTVSSAQAQTAPLAVTGPGFTETVTIGPAGVEFSRRFRLPAGSSVVHFSTLAAPPAAVPMASKDAHKPVFYIDDLQCGDPLMAPAVVSK